MCSSRILRRYTFKWLWQMKRLFPNKRVLNIKKKKKRIPTRPQSSLSSKLRDTRLPLHPRRPALGSQKAELRRAFTCVWSGLSCSWGSWYPASTEPCPTLHPASFTGGHRASDLLCPGDDPALGEELSLGQPEPWVSSDSSGVPHLSELMLTPLALLHHWP